jgi:hypothetical protein
MTTTPLDWIPLWSLTLFSFLLLWASMEGGYRLGRWRHAHTPDERDQPVAAMVSSILGLLALVLGFTFSFAASRFEARRQAVLDESNAIGTTYLRTRLLPEPHRSETAKLLREYTATRLKVTNLAELTEAITESERLQGLLWTQACEAAEMQPNPVTTGLFVQSLNDVIDMHATRILVGLRSRIPLVIWLTLMGLSMLGMTAVGYQAGLTTTRRSPTMLGLILAFVCVLYLIADLDRTHEGWLRISQQSMRDLQHSMESEHL